MSGNSQNLQEGPENQDWEVVQARAGDFRAGLLTWQPYCLCHWTQALQDTRAAATVLLLPQAGYLFAISPGWLSH